MRKLWRNPNFHSLLVALGAYSMALIGSKLSPAQISQGDSDLGLPGSLGIIALFTASHGILPIFFYGLFLKGKTKGPMGANCFIYFHMAFWYGAPGAVMLGMTLGLPAIPAILHLLFSQKGTRLWRCLQYGSTFFAILLLISIANPIQTGNWVLFACAVALQGGMLRVAHIFGAKIWRDPDLDFEEPDVISEETGPSKSEPKK